MWRVNAESGAAAAVTRDLFSYTDVNASSDGEAIVATAGLGESTLWTGHAGRLGELTQITTGAADGEGAAGLAWAPDGSIVYTSRASAVTAIFGLSGRGSGPSICMIQIRLPRRTSRRSGEWLRALGPRRHSDSPPTAARM